MKLKVTFRPSYIVILLLAAILNLIGVLVVRSATNMDTDAVSWQIIGSVVGFVGCIVLSLIDYHKLMKVHWIVYIAIVGILLAVLFLGEEANGAGRWITLPVIGKLQPAEFAKAGLVFCFAAYFEKHKNNLNEPRTILICIVLFALPAVLILLEPNLSTTIICFVIFACMYISAGLSWKNIALFSGIIIVIVAVIYFLFATERYENIPFLQDYQKKRILSFLDPSSDADAYRQQLYSIMAIGSGGFFGKGLNNTDVSSVKGGDFLIEEDTDFIFAIIGEELGFRGAIVILILFLVLIFAILFVAGKSNDIAGCVMCVGIGAWLAFQTFTNIAVSTALFPNTGVTLPFFSRGVSSLIAVYAGLGLVLNVILHTSSRERK